MKRTKLRSRLAFICALTTLVTFAAASVAVSIAFERSATNRLRGQLKSQAKQVDLATGDANLPSRAGGHELFAQLEDDNGTVSATSQPLRDLGNEITKSGMVNGTEMEVITIQSGTSTLRVATPRTDLDANIRRLNEILAFGAILSALLAMLLGRVLAGRALRPLVRIVATAQTIGRTGDLDQRVPGDEGSDELGRLARIFNGMVGRLKLAQDGQRRFIADASHELKTPITSLSGNLEFLQRRGLDERTKHEVIRDLRDDVDRLQGLAADLVELARADAGGSLRRESVRVDHAVQSTVSRIARGAEGHTITQELSPVSGHMDPESIDRIVGNLVANAVRYTPEGTEVHVSVAQMLDDDGREIAQIIVQDNGPGMAPSDAARAFDRFHRGETSRGTGGSGLGLAIVQQAARSHMGSVELEAESGAGCRFIVELPLGSLDSP